jgi:hypothetical protein
MKFPRNNDNHFFRKKSVRVRVSVNGPRKARSGWPKHVIDEIARGFLFCRTSLRQKRAREDSSLTTLRIVLQRSLNKFQITSYTLQPKSLCNLHFTTTLTLQPSFYNPLSNQSRPQRMRPIEC